MAPIGERAHEQRNRAESFGAVATDYDRYRPSYPAALIEDLAALHPATVLDVGCGTGIAAGLLVDAGLSVLGVEIDEQMADVARARGLPVEVASFETWDDKGRTFDLITSAQAWHWVDPALGIPKAARLLGEAGTLALIWNFDQVDASTRAVLDRVYQRHAPHLRESIATGSDPEDRRPYVADLHSSNLFADVRARTYEWEQTDTVERFVARLGTHSDHLILGARYLKVLQRDLVAALGAAGRDVVRTGGTYVILASIA